MIEDARFKRSLHSFITFTLLGIAALCVPSVLNFAYLFLSLVVILFITFRRSLVDLMDRFSTLNPSSRTNSKYNFNFSQSQHMAGAVNLLV